MTCQGDVAGLSSRAPGWSDLQVLQKLVQNRYISSKPIWYGVPKSHTKEASSTGRQDVPLQDIQTLEDTRSMNAHLVATSRADVYKATSHHHHHHHPPHHHHHHYYPPAHSLIDMIWLHIYIYIDRLLYDYIYIRVCVYVGVYHHLHVISIHHNGYSRPWAPPAAAPRNAAPGFCAANGDLCTHFGGWSSIHTGIYICYIYIYDTIYIYVYINTLYQLSPSMRNQWLWDDHSHMPCFDHGKCEKGKDM